MMQHDSTAAAVTKLRTLIAEARTLRGLPPDTQVNDLEGAIARARELRMAHALQPPTAPYPIRRKTLLARIRFTARTQGMYALVDDYVATCAASSLNGLDAEALQALDEWLERCVQSMQEACDWPLAPPAR